jgi:hypothetical protein
MSFREALSEDWSRIEANTCNLRVAMAAGLQTQIDQLKNERRAATP